jgi:hypothetical protein
VIDRPKEPDAGPQVRFCERRGGAIHRAYSTVPTGVSAKSRLMIRGPSRFAGSNPPPAVLRAPGWDACPGEAAATEAP